MVVTCKLVFIGSGSLKIDCNLGELGKRSLKIFDDFGGDEVGIGEVGTVFEAFVFEPKDVEIEFITLD